MWEGVHCWPKWMGAELAEFYWMLIQEIASSSRILGIPDNNVSLKFIAMSKNEEFKNDLEVLYRNCYRGKLHFNVWDDLNKSLNDKHSLYGKFSFFWVASLKAHLESAQLHLLKLFDKSSGSVTIDKVIEYAKLNKRDLFDVSSFNALEMFINDYKSEIFKYQGTIKSLNKIRNKHFVHLSKEYSKNYEELYKDYLELREDILEIIFICSNIIIELLRIGYSESRVMVLGLEYQTSELVQYLYDHIKETE